ncbi:hypothetical protein Tco_0707873 [Tanacetum coccineum]
MSALRRSDIENKLAWMVLTEPKVNPTKSGQMTKPYSSTSFIADCFISGFILRWRWRNLIPAESDSLPHAHAQTTKTYYKHQDSRIKKAQELKTKTSANSDIQDLTLRCQVYQ